MIDCPHWSPFGDHGGRCAIGKAGGKPSHGVCRLCLAGHDISTQPEDVPLRASGPGTHLKAMLGRFGIKEGSCACNSRAAHMDHMGPDWCEANIDTIVGWLREEAEKRKLPFAAFAAKILIKRAISKARRG